MAEFQTGCNGDVKHVCLAYVEVVFQALQSFWGAPLSFSEPLF